MRRYKDIQIFKNTMQDISFEITDDTNNVVDLTSYTGRIKVFLDIPFSCFLCCSLTPVLRMFQIKLIKPVANNTP